jgi:TPR repeat protein
MPDSMAKANVTQLFLLASSGDPQAQYDLALKHTKGEDGIPLDFEAAANFLQRAARAGHLDASFVLGALFQKGKDVRQDVEKAMDCCRLAAERGHIAAQFNLGYCYETGDGVDSDLDEAATWHKLAADQGDADAKTALDEVTPAKLEAQQRATALYPSMRAKLIAAKTGRKVA